MCVIHYFLYPYKCFYGGFYRGEIMPKLYANKSTGQLVITVPSAIAKAKSMKGGDEVEWKIDNLGNLILRPKMTVV